MEEAGAPELRWEEEGEGEERSRLVEVHSGVQEGPGVDPPLAGEGAHHDLLDLRHPFPLLGELGAEVLHECSASVPAVCWPLRCRRASQQSRR